MYQRTYRQGSAHVIVIAGLVLVLLGALGVIFYQNFIAKPSETVPKTTSETTKSAEKPKSSVEVIAGSDMNRYKNNEYGFEFEFPKTTYSATACADSTVGYDSNGNSKTVASYKTVANGASEMTVLEGDRRYMITSKQSVFLSDYQEHYMKCEVVPTTLALIDSYKDDFDFYIASEYRTWEVSRAEDKDHIADALGTLKSFQGKAVSYTIGNLENDRYSLSFRYDDNPDNVGGGAYKLWYYPSKKLLVYIGLGQSASFMKDESSEEYYITRIVDSFKLSQ